MMGEEFWEGAGRKGGTKKEGAVELRTPVESRLYEGA